MNTTRATAEALAKDVVAGVSSLGADVDVCVFPPFPYLIPVSEILGDSRITLGAQDVYFESEGAFTGEVSCSMLRDLNVKMVLAGHSERRHVMGEDDLQVNRKLHAALDADLDVVLCVGETIEQREVGETENVNLGQLSAGLDNVSADQMKRIVIAYEPVWAIGTGLTATPDDAEAVQKILRSRLASMYDEATAEATRIQYGGSVKAANAAALMAQPDVDGFLVGGASLRSGEFVEIVKAAGSIAAAR